MLLCTLFILYIYTIHTTTTTTTTIGPSGVHHLRDPGGRLPVRQGAPRGPQGRGHRLPQQHPGACARALRTGRAQSSAGED